MAKAKKEKKDPIGLFIPAGIFIGIGIGFLIDNVPMGFSLDWVRVSLQWL